MANRMIVVKRCAVDMCPHCLPDSYLKHNWCMARMPRGERISSRLKTFPKLCPLREI